MKVEGTGTVRCTRTNSHTGAVKVEDLKYFMRIDSLNNWWFYLERGVTGFESFQITKESTERLGVTGWTACAGTRVSWDKLYVLPGEIPKAIQDLQRAQQEGKVLYGQCGRCNKAAYSRMRGPDGSVVKTCLEHEAELKGYGWESYTPQKRVSVGPQEDGQWIQ